jgi:hypothetical protein
MGAVPLPPLMEKNKKKGVPIFGEWKKYVGVVEKKGEINIIINMPRLLLEQMTLFDGEMESLDSKPCTACRKVKKFSCFYKNRCKNGGLEGQCMDCRIESKMKRKEELRKDYKKIKRTLKRGDVSEKGLVFWGYDCLSKNFEHWVDKKRFEEKKKTFNKNRLNRYHNEPLRKLSVHISKNMSVSLQRINGSKKGQAKCEILGISIPELHEYLTSKFSEGMSWEKRGEWHIDHILPLSAAKTEEEVRMLWHYSNLQPLWANENLVKNNKYCPLQLEEFFSKRRLEMEASF